MNNLLKKGIEVELFAGNKDGYVVPISTELKENFSFIEQEPDQRNFEYITKPTKSYNELLNELVSPRKILREYLRKKDLILLPGSTISMPFDKTFFFSKPDDPFHNFIANKYGTRVITTSMHLNYGIEDTTLLFNLLNALRLDTPLFLALSAASPFYDGKVTDYQSFRWHNFPKTPDYVPFFLNHDSYIKWINTSLENKTLFNIRHLWNGIRPNGIKRPYDLNRIEIRICDFTCNTNDLISIVAFIESIILGYLENENWPKLLKQDESSLEQVISTIECSQNKVAKDGLNAIIYDWRSDSEKKVSSIIESILEEASPIAKNNRIDKYTSNINRILENGNEATQLLNSYEQTKSISKTIQDFATKFEKTDNELLQVLG